MASVKFYLKIYSLSLGFVVSFASFTWVMLILYVLSLTDPSATDLLMARYLDISFGLLAFTSSLALLYGAFVESKSWLSVWTLGSATVLVGCWTWYFYRKYGESTPESLDKTHDTLLTVSVVYAASVIPVVMYYKYLESPDNFLKPCKRINQGFIFATRSTSGGGGSCGVDIFWESDECGQGGKPAKARRATKDGYRVSIPIGKP
jgi:hypothetical protein